jgi:L-ascorbate metabolism protein UlaG (beta-lactamase superfamily)
LKIIFHGHSCFEIRTGENTIIVDPFLLGNPKADITPDQVTVDTILLTHGHNDHASDALAIALKNDAMIIAPYELAMFMQKQGAKVHSMAIGASREFSFGRLKLTQALHGSAFFNDKGEATYTGNPCGFLLYIEGKTIYISGDTGLFGDMESVIGRFNEIDVAILPIGDNFGMGPEDAVIAAAWLGTKYVIPCHYNTFDVITQDGNLFAGKLESQTKATAITLEPGEAFEL